jgi:gliding motility-associated-like protein
VITSGKEASIIVVIFLICICTKTFADNMGGAGNADFIYLPDSTACPMHCYDFHDASANAVSWLWTFDHGTPSTSTQQDPAHVCFDTTGTFSVKLVMSDGTTQDSIEKLVVVTSAVCDTADTALFIPNVITPNGDFRNDQFVIKNLPDKFKLTILGRWGTEIFTTTDKNKMWPEKPATDNITEGLYFYVLQITQPEGKREYNGSFTVIRNER